MTIIMKILYIVHDHKKNGATISFINLVQGLINRGITPVIVTNKQRKKDGNEDFDTFVSFYEIKCYEIPLVGMVLPQINNWRSFIKFPLRIANMFFINLYSEFLLKEIIRKEKPDIVHTNVGIIHCGYHVAHQLKIPHIWHLREYQDKDFGWKIYPSKQQFIKMLHNSYVITITFDILRYFSLERSPNAICIYNGILHYKNTKSIWPKDNYFMSANNILPAKSMETTIMGFSKFVKVHKNYKLKICGTGDRHYIYTLKELIRSCGCESNVEWLGFVDNIPNLLSHSMGLIVSSKNEGFGRMTAEACFMGCMPIGKNTAGTKEIIDNTGGCIFNNAEELEERLSYVVNLTDDQYKKIMIQAQKRAVESYSIESNVDKTYEFYKSILL